MSNLMKLDNFDQIKDRFVQVSDEKTFFKEASFAVQHFNKNGYLNKATTESKLEAVLNVAQIGLTLNPVLKQAYLVPRWDGQKGAVVCALEPSYQGLVKLITDTGSAQNVYCHLVYKGDEFEEALGTTPEIIHRPKRTTKEVEVVYAVAVLHNGTKQIEVMSVDEVNGIRARSESYKAYTNKKAKSSIWVSDWGEMARKTVIKRLCKYLPKTDRWEKLAAAIEVTNTDFEASIGQINIIESLLMHANIGTEEQSAIFNELTTMSHERASECIQYLKDNQVDPIDAGHPYSQTDIKNKQSNHMNNVD